MKININANHIRIYKLLFFARPNSLFLKSKATGNFLSYPSPDSFNLLLDPLNNTK